MAETAAPDSFRQIGEVADSLGLSLRTLRHYDELGVVSPSGRSVGGFRLYTDEDVARLRTVMGLKPIGFALEEIREVLELLALVEDPDAPQEAWDRLDIYAALASERFEKHRARIELAADLTGRLTAITEAHRT
jgi:DNA-binding transcriptional MerR regulator